jgi:hypothetical protein
MLIKAILNVIAKLLINITSNFNCINKDDFKLNINKWFLIENELIYSFNPYIEGLSLL